MTNNTIKAINDKMREQVHSKLITVMNKVRTATTTNNELGESLSVTVEIAMNVVINLEQLTT